MRGLADVIGEEELSPLDKQYLKFGEAFETRFLNQGEYENRSIEATLELGWDVLSTLPQDELHRVSDVLLNKYYREKEEAPAGTAPVRACSRAKWLYGKAEYRTDQVELARSEATT